MRDGTVVKRVAVVDGRRYDRVAGILADEPTSRFAKGRDRGNLYALIEMTGAVAIRDTLAERIAEIVHDTYYSQRRSVTAGLRQAIREANSFLFRENENSLAGDQGTAGISCAVLRGEDLYIAQAGPAVLYVAGKRGVNRFPEISPWLDGRGPWEKKDAAPLGRGQDPRVDLFHTTVSRGDTLLFVSTGLANYLPPQAWGSILVTVPTEALIGELLVAAEGRDMSALVVRLSEEESGERVTYRPSPASVSALEPVPAPSPRQTLPKTGALQIQKHMRALAGILRRGLAAFWAMLVTLLEHMVPGQPKVQQAPPDQAAGAKPPADQSRKRQDLGAGGVRSSAVQKLLLLVAVAIPVIVSGLVGFTLIERGQARQAEIDGLWQSAQDRWSQAQVTGDPTVVRALLSEAQDHLDQYLEKQSDHEEALELQGRIAARLDDINQVQRVPWEGVLRDYPAGADLSRVVVEGVHVFVMDRGAGVVYHHQMDEFQQALRPDAGEPVVVRKGDQVGDILVTDLIDMAWMPVGSGRTKAGLVILESSGALLEYDPANKKLAPLRLASTETWQLPRLVGSHSGRFYLLDPKANEIWRYSPTPDGYSDAPDSWLQVETDLAGVTDMAVGDSIYLVYADGRIAKLSAGEPDTFDLASWDTPPQSPKAIFTRPLNETQWVYIADAGNSRIVQVGKDGLFRRQFRLVDAGDRRGSDPLAGVTSLFVDEIGGRAFFLSGHSLYMLILPD